MGNAVTYSSIQTFPANDATEQNALLGWLHSHLQELCKQRGNTLSRKNRLFPFNSPPKQSDSSSETKLEGGGACCNAPHINLPVAQPMKIRSQARPKESHSCSQEARISMVDTSQALSPSVKIICLESRYPPRNKNPFRKALHTPLTRSGFERNPCVRHQGSGYKLEGSGALQWAATNSPTGARAAESSWGEPMWLRSTEVNLRGY